jgi:hypothetical protein
VNYVSTEYSTTLIETNSYRVNSSNMSLDDDTYNANTLTILDDHAFKSDLITMMSDIGPETNELKCRAKAILRVMGSTLTSVHGVRTSGLLDAMIEGSEQAGLSSGVRYAAAAIIVAYQKGEASDSSASELTKLAQDWLLFFLWPCMLFSLFASCFSLYESQKTLKSR